MVALYIYSLHNAAWRVEKQLRIAAQCAEQHAVRVHTVWLGILEDNPVQRFVPGSYTLSFLCLTSSGRGCRISSRQLASTSRVCIFFLLSIQTFDRRVLIAYGTVSGYHVKFADPWPSTHTSIFSARTLHLFVMDASLHFHHSTMIRAVLSIPAIRWHFYRGDMVSTNMKSCTLGQALQDGQMRAMQNVRWKSSLQHLEYFHTYANLQTNACGLEFSNESGILILARQSWKSRTCPDIERRD